ncbi:hypothetical protein GGD62_001470 [Bradyrhizobium sp. ERR14]|nr:hypothetical protein [Bradyrhizobium sp. ERR14]
MSDVGNKRRSGARIRQVRSTLDTRPPYAKDTGPIPKSARDNRGAANDPVSRRRRGFQLHHCL